ncbi:hypothetical protein HU200_059271 [Digitaria exilis]|uniref:Structural maintenance of chromosomes protein 5 n=1 Tax=Digitaria exilis TaxID=1010633 RepID=A0A835AM01_9POAL|nr:hypothetical protein HU200_059271 [Digitaria exilis]
MAPPRAVKRAKLVAAPPPEREEDDYVAGNIVEIELCNFMTYDRLVCRPGPRLNLVVGPNGSGKSSLVCAIALGLAGEPNVRTILGRASSVGAFVKRGGVAGYVKISLRGETPDDRICITRRIDTENKSEWLLNGTIDSLLTNTKEDVHCRCCYRAIVLKREVIDIIKKFNIQVNNLTQALKQKEHTLNNLKALNAEHEKDVERIRLRDNLLRKAELMKKKLPWLKFDKMKKEFEDVVQKQEKTAKEKMEEAARIWDDAKRPISMLMVSIIHFGRNPFLYRELKKQKAVYTSNMEKIMNRENENMTNRQKVMDQELQLNIELKATFDDADFLKKQDKSHQQRILKAKEDLASAEKELEDLHPYELPRAQMVS